MKRSLNWIFAAVFASFLLQETSVGAQFAKAANYNAGSEALVLTAGDFNNDGNPDIATVSYGSNDVAVLLGAGDGTLGRPIHIPAGGSPISLTAADVNGDGNLDLAVLDIQRGVNILLGNGDGTFQSPVLYPCGPDPLSIAATDLNHDGKLDLVIGSTKSTGQSGALAVLLGNGNGSFQPPVLYCVGLSLFTVAVGDLNGDSFPDVVAANDNSHALAILLGNGDGTLQSPQQYGGLTSSAHWIALGDFNHDGKLDVVAILIGHGSHRASTTIIGFGNGDGSFAPPTAVFKGYQLAGIAIADFNSDGNIDLGIAGGGVSGRAITLMGNGDGTFQAPQSYRTLGFPTDVVATDLNNDGYPDLIVLAGGASVLLNNGANAAQAKKNRF
jgi:hypothetical protein